MGAVPLHSCGLLPCSQFQSGLTWPHHIGQRRPCTHAWTAPFFSYGAHVGDLRSSPELGPIIHECVGAAKWEATQQSGKSEVFIWAVQF